MRLVAFLAAVSLFTGIAAGQTTRTAADAPPRWERLVTSLTAAVVSHDPQAIQSLVPTECRIARFNAEPDADTSQLIDAISEPTVLGSHAYIHPPPSLVTDIAHDANSSNIISDFAKHSLNLEDKHGRTIAMRWMTQALSATDGDPIGIIVLWDTRPNADDTHRLLFVLLKGQSDGDGFKFSRIVYGDPLH